LSAYDNDGVRYVLINIEGDLRHRRAAHSSISRRRRTRTPSAHADKNRSKRGGRTGHPESSEKEREKEAATSGRGGAWSPFVGRGRPADRVESPAQKLDLLHGCDLSGHGDVVFLPLQNFRCNRSNWFGLVSIDSNSAYTVLEMYCITWSWIPIDAKSTKFLFNFTLAYPLI
jgi:hypothetical protein